MTTELHRLMFDRFCEMLNCEVPIEEYSEEIIKTILRAGYAVVPAAPRPAPRVEREPTDEECAAICALFDAAPDILIDDNADEDPRVFHGRQMFQAVSEVMGGEVAK